MKHSPIVAAVLLFAAVCGSAAFWGQQWIRPGQKAVVAAAAPAPAPPAIAAAAGLFGGRPADAAAAGTFQLKGVIADGPDGVALLAAEGKPALAVGVGREAAPGVTVREVHQRYVLLDEGGTVRRLDLPEKGIAGLELVAATTAAAPPAGVPDARPPAAPAHARATLPAAIVNPEALAPPPQPPQPGQQKQIEEMRRMEEMARARGPSGIGPGAYGARPNA